MFTKYGFIEIKRSHLQCRDTIALLYYLLFNINEK